MSAFIDSHCHLADPSFEGEVEGVVERARAAGARALVCIGESIPAAERAARLSERFAGLVVYTVGLHPHEAATWPERDHPQAILDHVNAGAVAIGECGLDYHYDNSPRDIQRDVLSAQLQLAAETRKPIVLHTRDAEADTIAFLADAAAARVTGVLHCFTGTRSLADAALDAGWYISLSGIITFRRFADHDLVRAIPGNRLMIESDSPYLAPVPYRGKRNEPAYVHHTLAQLATIRDTHIDAMAAQLIDNTTAFFGFSLPHST